MNTEDYSDVSEFLQLLFDFLNQNKVKFTSENWDKNESIQKGVMENFKSSFPILSDAVVQFWNPRIKGRKVIPAISKDRSVGNEIVQLSQEIKKQCLAFLSDAAENKYVLLSHACPILPWEIFIKLASQKMKSAFIEIFLEHFCPKNQKINWEILVFKRNRTEAENVDHISDFCYSRIQEFYASLFPNNNAIIRADLTDLLAKMRRKQNTVAEKEKGKVGKKNELKEQEIPRKFAQNLFDWSQEEVEEKIKNELKKMTGLQSQRKLEFQDYIGLFSLFALYIS